MRPFSAPYGVPGDEFDLAKAAKQECPLCICHAAAQLQLHSAACPQCGHRIKTHEAVLEVVGERLDNPYGQRYAKVPVVDCEKCGILVALWPTPVLHEESHDVLYLGGATVGGGRQEQASIQKALVHQLIQAIRGPIAQFLSRYRSNRDLKADDLIGITAKQAAAVLYDSFTSAGVTPGEHKISEAMADILRQSARLVCSGGCEPECWHHKARMLAHLYRVADKDTPTVLDSLRRAS